MKTKHKSGGIFGALVALIFTLIIAMVLLVIIPISATILMIAGVGGAAASCIPGNNGTTTQASVTPALDLSNIDSSESRPVINSLPTPYTIPANYYDAYKSAAEAYNMDWEILAAVGWRESKHGTYDPAWRENDYRAMGPMQFIPAAWEHHGVYADGTSGTPPLENRNNLADAVASAANKLTDQGIRNDERGALWKYNNAWWYVDQIQEHAQTLKTGDYTVMESDGGTTNSGGDGGLGGLFSTASFGVDCSALQNISYGAAMAPDEITAQAVEFALAQAGKPYCWGGTGPNCYDCSGLLVAAYQSAGVALPARMSQDLWNVGERIPENEIMPGDLIFFNVNMSGREDANRGNPGHVAMVVGDDQMIEAWCTSCGPIEVRPWRVEHRDVAGFTRPLLDSRLAHHIPDVPDSGENEESEIVAASGVGALERSGLRILAGRPEIGGASRRRHMR